jgi:hypothetical protein
VKPAERLMSAHVIDSLPDAAAHGDRHIAEIERDLAQMDTLLDEAIKKLCASFMAIHHAVAAQQEVMEGLLAGPATAEGAARLAAIRAEIGQQVGAAVTGLQFQDMTSQLLRRVALHLDGLRGMLGAPDAGGADAGPEGFDAAICLDATNGASGDARPGMARSTVKQRHMESGDIELF